MKTFHDGRFKNVDRFSRNEDLRRLQRTDSMTEGLSKTFISEMHELHGRCIHASVQDA